MNYQNLNIPKIEERLLLGLHEMRCRHKVPHWEIVVTKSAKNLLTLDENKIPYFVDEWWQTSDERIPL